MPVPRVIYGLAKKRAELVAEIGYPQGRHDYCRAGIAAIDAVLPLWDVEPPVLKRRYKAKPTIIRQLTRKVVSALRDAPEPIMTWQVVDAVSVGIELDTTTRRIVTRLVIQRMRDLRREGRIRHAGNVGRRKRWELCP